MLQIISRFQNNYALEVIVPVSKCQNGNCYFFKNKNVKWWNSFIPGRIWVRGKE